MSSGLDVIAGWNIDTGAQIWKYSHGGANDVIFPLCCNDNYLIAALFESEYEDYNHVYPAGKWQAEWNDYYQGQWGTNLGTEDLERYADFYSRFTTESEEGSVKIAESVSLLKINIKTGALNQEKCIDDSQSEADPFGYTSSMEVVSQTLSAGLGGYTEETTFEELFGYIPSYKSMVIHFYAIAPDTRYIGDPGREESTEWHSDGNLVDIPTFEGPCDVICYGVHGSETEITTYQRNGNLHDWDTSAMNSTYFALAWNSLQAYVNIDQSFAAYRLSDLQKVYEKKAIEGDRGEEGALAITKDNKLFFLHVNDHYPDDTLVRVKKVNIPSATLEKTIEFTNTYNWGIYTGILNNGKYIINKPDVMLQFL